MEPQNNHFTSTETGVITTSGVPIETITESHIANPDVSSSEKGNPKSSQEPDSTSEPAPAYSFVPADTPVQIEPVPQVTNVTPLHLLREQPAWIDCPFCARRAMTRVQHDDSSTTMLASFLCCLICVCLVCVPSMTGMFQDTSHYCTNCRTKVAHKPHNGQMQSTVYISSSSERVPSRLPLAEHSTQYPAVPQAVHTSEKTT